MHNILRRGILQTVNLMHCVLWKRYSPDTTDAMYYEETISKDLKETDAQSTTKRYPANS